VILSRFEYEVIWVFADDPKEGSTNSTYPDQYEKKGKKRGKFLPHDGRNRAFLTEK
jgi:hypothetical protein